jgi:carboxylesterase type B
LTYLTEKRNTKYSQLHNQTENQPSNNARYITLTFAPVIDGDFLPAAPAVRLRQLASTFNQTKRRTIIAGNVANESSYFLYSALNGMYNFYSNDSSKGELPESVDASDLYRTLAANVMPYNLMSDKYVNDTAKMYKIPIPKGQIAPTTFFNKIDEIASDIDFRCPTVEFADALQRMGHQVFKYEFLRRTSATTFPNWLGAMHGYEIEYVFGQPFNGNFKSQFYNFTEEEKSLSERVMQYWANLAIYNNPNGNLSDKVTWPEYTKATKKFLKFDTPADHFDIGQFFRVEQCRFWEKFKINEEY